MRTDTGDLLGRGSSRAASRRHDFGRAPEGARPKYSAGTRPTGANAGSAGRLLDRDGGAGALKGGLGLLGGLLVDLFENGLRRAVDQVLGLLEAEAREATNLLDDLDLLVAGALEDDVELVLLRCGLRSRAAARATLRCGNSHRSGGGDAEGVLELLHELG